jgi:hypothetical protein
MAEMVVFMDRKKGATKGAEVPEKRIPPREGEGKSDRTRLRSGRPEAVLAAEREAGVGGLDRLGAGAVAQ